MANCMDCGKLGDSKVDIEGHWGRHGYLCSACCQPETEELGRMPEYILAYMAPMLGGTRERREMWRRQILGLMTGDRLGRRISPNLTTHNPQ